MIEAVSLFHNLFSTDSVYKEYKKGDIYMCVCVKNKLFSLFSVQIFKNRK